MARINKITVTQAQHSVVLKLLEKRTGLTMSQTSGHWYLDDGNLGQDVFLKRNAIEENYWYFQPTSDGGLLDIGARIENVYVDGKPTTQPVSYVTLFGVKRTAEGCFRVADASGTGKGKLYEAQPEGKTGFIKFQPISWESECFVGEYAVPKNSRGK